MISGIRSNVSINAVRESNGLNSVLSDVIVHTDIPTKDSADSPAALLDISKRAKQISLEFKNMSICGDSLNPDEDFLSREYVTRLKQEAVDTMEKPTADPFEDEEAMSKIQYAFSDYSPEHSINNILEGKAKNASVVTNELSNMLRQTVTNRDANVKQRAENRETALKCAEYIADKYLDNPNEAKEFMSAINDIYDEDVAMDKGYIVLNSNTGTEFIKSTDIQLGNGTTISKDLAFSSYIRAYREANGISQLKAADMGDLFQEFINNSAETREKWAAEEIKDYNNNESKVTETIKNVKLNFNYSLFHNSIARLLKAF